MTNIAIKVYIQKQKQVQGVVSWRCLYRRKVVGDARRIYKKARENAVIELYLARNLLGSRQYTCRNIVQSKKYPVRIGGSASIVQFYVHLFVEHTIVFVDIGDVAFFLVETLPREFAFLVDAKNLRY